MSANLFMDRPAMPDEAALTLELGEAKKYFDHICLFIEDETGTLTREWKYYDQKSGWVLKLLSKKRNLLFVSPKSGYFILAFVFGNRAVEAVIRSQLPEDIKTELVNARKYAEGRSIRLEIRDDSLLESVKELIRIKLAN